MILQQGVFSNVEISVADSFIEEIEVKKAKIGGKKRQLQEFFTVLYDALCCHPLVNLIPTDVRKVQELVENSSHYEN